MANVRQVRAAFESFVEARRARDTAVDDEVAQAENRHTYETLSKVCHEYVRQFNDRNGMPRNIINPDEHFPPEIAEIFHAMIEGWLVGKVDQTLRDLTGGAGKPGPSQYDKNDIKDACRYMQAVEKKLITDKSHVARISAWYGVARSTSQGWLRQSRKEDLLNGFMDDYPDSQRIEIIKGRARVAGKRYSTNRRRSAAGVSGNQSRV